MGACQAGSWRTAGDKRLQKGPSRRMRMWLAFVLPMHLPRLVAQLAASLGFCAARRAASLDSLMSCVSTQPTPSGASTPDARCSSHSGSHRRYDACACTALAVSQMSEGIMQWHSLQRTWWQQDHHRQYPCCWLPDCPDAAQPLHCAQHAAAASHMCTVLNQSSCCTLTHTRCKCMYKGLGDGGANVKLMNPHQGAIRLARHA
jgi:hypothetical protein